MNSSLRIVTKIVGVRTAGLTLRRESVLKKEATIKTREKSKTTILPAIDTVLIIDMVA